MRFEIKGRNTKSILAQLYTHTNPKLTKSPIEIYPSMQETRTKVPNPTWALLLFRQRPYLSLQWSTPASHSRACVCVWDSSVGVQQKTEAEKEELASKGRAVLCGCMVTHLPLQGPLGARRWGRFTAGWLLRNEPQEASQRRARGISTIINNPVLREKEHQLSSCSHASEAHCRKIFAMFAGAPFCAAFWENYQDINQNSVWFSVILLWRKTLNACI